MTAASPRRNPALLARNDLLAKLANNADGPRTGGVCAIPSPWGRV
jgi:hypothetical protein